MAMSGSPLFSRPLCFTADLKGLWRYCSVILREIVCERFMTSSFWKISRLGNSTPSAGNSNQLDFSRAHQMQSVGEISGTFTVRLADLLGPKWLFGAKVGFVCFAECFAKRCSQHHFCSHPIAGNGHKIGFIVLEFVGTQFVARPCKH